MSRRSALPVRFQQNLVALGLSGEDVHLLAAVSGGCDSVALLHLLRRPELQRARLTAAHFDHAMRATSAADADWVAGLCRAWRVPLVRARANEPPRSEAEARRKRYAFLRRAAAAAGATHIVTAHHADDQAETVLFRALRGTGPAGLAAMAPLSESGIARPLLPFWRAELERYAREAGLRWRSDATNRSSVPARNRIRNQILPLIERSVAPAARRNLVRLAQLERETAHVLDTLLEPWARAVARAEGDALLLARQPFREYDPPLAAQLLRNVMRRFDVGLSRAGTRAALQFITDAPSGRELWLAGGLRLSTEFDTVRVEHAPEPKPPGQQTPDAVLIAGPPAASQGSGVLRLGGRPLRVAWRAEIGPSPPAARWSAVFALADLRFPLLVRRWQPGDRIRQRAGRRSLKKLFGEQRVPRTERSRRPVLVDATGAVLWVAGVAQTPDSAPRPAEDALIVTIDDA